MRLTSFRPGLMLLVLAACGDDGGDVTAPPETASFIVSVTGEGSGAGRVTTAIGQEPAISCDLVGAETPAGNCTASYPEATVVTLTVTPESNSLFDGWGGDAATCGTTPTCSLTITANQSVVARLSTTATTGTVEVVSSAFYPQPNFGVEGAVIWVAEVRNTSSQVVESAEIDFTTYDAAGAILATSGAFVGPIPPGETRVEQSFADYLGTEASAEFEVMDVQFGTGETNLSGAEIVSSNWQLDPDFGSEGAVTWVVEVRNTTSAPLGSVEIEFSTYDAAGQIVAAAFTFIDDIPPGETRLAEGVADYHGTEATAKFQVGNITDGVTASRSRR